MKRETTLNDRRPDFLDAAQVFDGANYQVVDDRYEYGEERMVVVWTQRGETRHIISMRKANDREQARYGKFLD